MVSHTHALCFYGSALRWVNCVPSSNSGHIAPVLAFIAPCGVRYVGAYFHGAPGDVYFVCEYFSQKGQNDGDGGYRASVSLANEATNRYNCLLS